MDLRLSIANQTDFGLQLARCVASISAADTNLALSPVSIHAVLGLLAAGSKGATLDQLLSVLRAGAAADLNQLSSQVVSLVLADGSASGGPNICFSNGVWVDASMPLKEAFKAIANKDYKAEAKAVDFQSKEQISNAETESAIPDNRDSNMEDGCSGEDKRFFEGIVPPIGLLRESGLLVLLENS